MSLWSRLVIAVKAFRENYVTSDFLDVDDFEDYGARLVRYQILWAWYENTAFRDIHKWAQLYRKSYGLYKYIRNIYNPSFRLSEFWKMLIWGGLLDPEARDVGAIPIVAKDDKLRESISALWLASGWATNKDLVSLWGATLGDVAIRVVDDTVHSEVRLEPIHPSSIKDLTIDARGYCKGYVLEEVRELNGKDVTYTETVTRGEGDLVLFKTEANGKEYAWNGAASSWSEAYGFVPLVSIQHNNVGFKFGWAEVHPLRSKVNEVEDLASKLHDYIRKAVDPVWLFNFKRPRGAETSNTGTPGGRDETPAIYVPDPAAKAQALITDQLDIQKTSEEIGHLLKETERDYPELQMDIWTAGEDTSGRALRQARQRVETKVIQRRANYDGAIVRAHQMAIAIGGFRNYPGYEGFGLDSYEQGKLDHTINPMREVFKTDPREEAEIDKLFWDSIKLATEVGVPVELLLKKKGWNEDLIAEVTAGIAKKEAKKAAEDAAKAEQEHQRLEAVNASRNESGNSASKTTGPRGTTSSKASQE